MNVIYLFVWISSHCSQFCPFLLLLFFSSLSDQLLVLSNNSYPPCIIRSGTILSTHPLRGGVPARTSPISMGSQHSRSSGHQKIAVQIWCCYSEERERYFILSISGLHFRSLIKLDRTAPVASREQSNVRDCSGLWAIQVKNNVISIYQGVEVLDMAKC